MFPVGCGAGSARLGAHLGRAPLLCASHRPLHDSALGLLLAPLRLCCTGQEAGTLEPQDRISADRTGGTSKPQHACWVPGDISSSSFLPFPSSVSRPALPCPGEQGFCFLAKGYLGDPPSPHPVSFFAVFFRCVFLGLH